MKAGSKVYKGNNTTVNIINDITGTRTSTQNCLVFVNNSSFLFMPLSVCFSGDKSPVDFGQFAV